MRKSDFGKLLEVVFVAVVASAAVACNFHQEKNESGGSDGPQILGKGQVDFVMVKEQVLGPRCQGCHSPAGRGSKVPLTSFEEVQKFLPKIKFAVFEKKSMPPSRAPQLSADQSNMLWLWLDDGAPETATGVARAPVQSPSASGVIERPVRWALVSEKVFVPACVSCHGANNPDGLTNLENIEQVRSTIGTTYYTSVVDQSMPPKNSGLVLSTLQKDILSFWIADGMKDSPRVGPTPSAAATSN